VPRYKSRSELAYEAVLVAEDATSSQRLKAASELDKIRRKRAKVAAAKPKKTEPAPAIDTNSICPDCSVHYDDCRCIIELPDSPTLLWPPEVHEKYQRWLAGDNAFPQETPVMDISYDALLQRKLGGGR
jgi:hypothetical protein